MTNTSTTSPTRRTALGLVGSVAVLSLAALPRAFADEAADAAALAEPGQIADVWLGSPDAKVTVIEYASLTCSHCAAFSVGAFQEMRRAYLDTGKVRYALREYPLDPLAVAAAMLARCRGAESYYQTVEAFFAGQGQWAFTEKPYEAIKEAASKVGINATRFEGCMKDQSLYEGVLASREKAARKLSVNSTPTFFVNGKRHVGGIAADGLDALFGPLLK